MEAPSSREAPATRSRACATASGPGPFELGEDGRIDPDLLPAPLQADNLDGARPDIDARKVPVPPKEPRKERH